MKDGMFKLFVIVCGIAFGALTSLCFIGIYFGDTSVDKARFVDEILDHMADTRLDLGRFDGNRFFYVKAVTITRPSDLIFRDEMLDRVTKRITFCKVEDGEEECYSTDEQEYLDIQEEAKRRVRVEKEILKRI